jgi:DNA primase
MFPIHNSRGILVGFSGRTADPENKAKYINSPESSVFSKKKLLYGMHLAKKRAKEVDRLIIVEGYMDVIAMHQHGFSETVAVMGTALTEFHAKELSKYTKNIVLMFDSDNAGQSAVRKSIPSLQSEGLVIQIATLKDKDPGDFFIEKNRDDMAKLIASSDHYMTHYMKKLQAMEDIKNPTKKSEGVMLLTQILMNEKDPIVKDHYLKTIAEQFDVSQNIVNAYVSNGQGTVQKKTQISLKMDSKYKKSEDMVLYFLIASLPFRQRHLSECIDIISYLQNNELKTLLETSELVDYDIIEQITHSEIKGYLLSLIIKFTEFKIKYELEGMEEYLHLLKQSRFNQRISEIKHLLSSSQGNKQKELLLELSELIKKIK